MPDYSSFARFRSGKAKDAVEDLFYQFVQRLAELEETEYEEVFIDGTKIESMANRYTFVWKTGVEKNLAKLKEKAKEVFNECGGKGNLTRKKLRELADKQLPPNAEFVHGIGKRKSEWQKRYQRLLKYEAADPMCGKRKHQFVSPSTVRSVHKILRSAFEQAVKWELMEKNPCIYATLPKYTSKKRDIWTAETLFRALKVCDDPKLRLCINLSFSCSLRLGELLGLTWDCVDIFPESIDAGRASIYINKELQRVDVASLNALENKNVITRFPSLSSRCTTVQVLKSPKTDSSIRTIFLPKTVAEMLVEFKAEQDMTKEALGAEYTDYNLVVAGPLGMPTEQSTINGALKRLIEKNNLPKVVFHSFRHSSITYKLKLNGGDIKAVQGDSGHAQASMVTEQYAHILDDDRRLNAQRFDDFFYQHQGAEPEMPHQTAQSIPENSAVDADAAAALTKLLANPSMAELIKNLAKNL